MRVVRALFVAVAFSSLILVTLGFAEEKLDGKKLYFEYCRPCHQPDSADGEFSPMSLIQEQWEEFFDETLASTHADVVDPRHGDKKVLELMTPKLLKALKKFTIEGAADSERPMSCDVPQG